MTYIPSFPLGSNVPALTVDTLVANKAASFRGAFPAGTTTASTFANQGLTLGWNLSGAGGELNLLLGRQLGTTGGLNVFSVNSAGTLDSTAPILTLDRQGNLRVSGTLTAGSGNTPGDLNLASFILPGDADATAGFNRAIARAIAISGPVCIDVPAGNYFVSAAITATLTGNTGITLRGAGSGATLIRQTADADLFVITLANYGPAYGLRGCFNVTGLTLMMACPTASSTRTALSLGTAGVSGNTGVPLLIEDVVIASPGAGGGIYWGTGLAISAFANVGHISRVAVYSANFQGVGITLSGNPQSFTTQVFFKDVSLYGLNKGLVLGEFLQGCGAENLNTVNTVWALVSDVQIGLNSNGGAISDNLYFFTNCYLMGKTLFHAKEGAVASFQVNFTSCYFDGNVNGAAPPIDRHLALLNVPAVTLTGCTFNGALPPPSQPIVAIYMENQSATSVVNGCVFSRYGAPGDGSTSCVIYLGLNTTDVTVCDNVLDYNTRAFTIVGTGHSLANNRVSRCDAGNDGYWFHGTKNSPSPTAAVFASSGIATISPNSGLDLGAQGVVNTPYVDFHSSGGAARDYDSRIIASGGSATVDGRGTLDYIAALHRLAGQATVAGGLGVFGHAAPATQPATPATLADVINVLRGCGLCA